MAKLTRPEKKSSFFVIASVAFIFAVMTMYVLERYAGFSVIDMVTGTPRSIARTDAPTQALRRRTNVARAYRRSRSFDSCAGK